MARRPRSSGKVFDVLRVEPESDIGASFSHLLYFVGEDHMLPPGFMMRDGSFSDGSTAWWSTMLARALAS